jgi:hypothetical protein
MIRDKDIISDDPIGRNGGGTVTTPPTATTPTPSVPADGDTTFIPRMKTADGDTTFIPRTKISAPTPTPVASPGRRRAVATPPPAKTTPDIPKDGSGGDKGGGGTKIIPAPFEVRPNPYQDRSITVRGFGNNYLPALWGPNETGGVVCYEKLLTSGALLVLYEVCWGQINQFTQFTCGGKTFASLGVTFESYVGTKTQIVSPLMLANESRWTSRLPGKAYVVALFPAPTESNPPINHEDFKCQLEGRICRDPRLDASLVNRYYTTCPALIWADWKTARPFGERHLDSMIDWTSSVTTTANDCDFARSDASKRYTMSFRVDSSKGVEQVVNELRGHAMMFETYNSGKYQIWMDKLQAASSIVFSDDVSVDNIIDASFRVKGRGECPTKVRVNFINVANGFKPDYAEFSDPLIATGAVELIYHEYNYYGVGNWDHAYRLCIQYYNRGKQDKEISLLVGPEGTQVLPGVVITVTSYQLNFANRKCIVTGCSPQGSKWLIHCELYDDATYDDVPRTTSSYSPPANPTPYDTVPECTTPTLSEDLFTLQSGEVTTKLKVAFTSPSNYSFFWGVRVLVLRSGYPQYVLDTFKLSPGTNSLYIPLTHDLATYTATVQTINSIGKASSGVSSSPYAAQGKILNPSDVPYLFTQQRATEVYVSWQPPQDKDISEYEIRRGLTTDSWATAVFVTRVSGTASYFLDKPANSGSLPSGSWRYFIKAIDFSKLMSVNASTSDIVVMNAGPALVESVLSYSPFSIISDPYNSDTYRNGAATYEGWRLQAGGVGSTVAPGKFFLSRTHSPANSQAEIVASSYTSIQQWETLKDAPRRGGQGLWAPLDSQVTVASFPIAHFIGGTSTRNYEVRIRYNGVKRVGVDNVNTISRLETLVLGNLVGPTGQTGPTGGNIATGGLQWTTNNPLSQVMVLPTDYNSVIARTLERKIVSLGPLVDLTTDASGNASYTLPAELQLPSGCTISITPSITSSPTAHAGWKITSINNTSFTVNVTSDTGANVSGATVRVIIEDRGLGGTVFVS